jgi:hypothetical protein
MLTDLEIDVFEDLTYLSEHFLSNVKDSDIKQAMTILRKLLIEDSLGCAWRNQEGFTNAPFLPCNDLQKFVKTQANIPSKYLAVAGGAYAQLRDQHSYTHAPLIYDLLSNTFYVTHARVNTIDESNSFFDQSPLNNFLNQPCILADKFSLKRCDLIKYYCYKKNGCHPPSLKTKDVELYKRIELMIPDLIKLRTAWNFVFGKPGGIQDALAFELLGIIQSINSSSDIQKLKEKLLGKND